MCECLRNDVMLMLCLSLHRLHVRIQKVLSEGSNTDNVFYLMRGERIKISLKVGQYRPASEMAFNGVSLVK